MGPNYKPPPPHWSFVTINVVIVVVFRTVPVRILNHIGDGYGKVFVERGVVVVGCTNDVVYYVVVGSVIEGLLGSESSVLFEKLKTITRQVFERMIIG